MSWLSQQALRILKEFLEHPSTDLSGSGLIKATGLLSGTVYPILLRFERLGLLKSRWESDEPSRLGRPRRRLYRLTGEGAKVATDALRELATSASFLLARS
jgi:PadR family transcriptional regulator